MKHRKPPLPESFTFNRTPQGVCRWCEKPILKADGAVNRRRRWHPKCTKLYLFYTSPQSQRRRVFERDGGICANCGRQCANESHLRRNSLRAHSWEVDHIKPLIEANGDLRYWDMDNLQTLCVRCHQKKTARERKRSGMRK